MEALCWSFVVGGYVRVSNLETHRGDDGMNMAYLCYGRLSDWGGLCFSWDMSDVIVVRCEMWHATSAVIEGPELWDKWERIHRKAGEREGGAEREIERPPLLKKGEK